jgi:uncharacterized membrane protein YdjX (TVP38/TMEM64 family)
VFRYFLTARAQKLEETNIKYACLARVVREGRLLVAIILRYSAIPGHCEDNYYIIPRFLIAYFLTVTTAVFSTCGMGIWTYIIAAIISLPKQLATVYLGYALSQSKEAGIHILSFTKYSVLITTQQKQLTPTPYNGLLLSSPFS